MHTALRGRRRQRIGVLLAVLGAPTGKRLAPIMAELVPTLRRFRELMITDEVAAALIAMSPATMDRRLGGDRATMDRRLGGDRATMVLRGHSHTKPGFAAEVSDPDPHLGAVGRRGAGVSSRC